MEIKVGSIFYINGTKCLVTKEENDKFDVEIDTSSLLTQTQVDELSYQQRLDKVLSKTEKYINDYVAINYTNEKFYLLTADEIEISLDTVESLLKDMEAQDE